MTQKILLTGTWCQVPGLLFRTHKHCLRTAEWEIETTADVTNKGLDSETKDDMEIEDDDFTEADDAKDENIGQTESKYITNMEFVSNRSIKMSTFIVIWYKIKQ